MPGNGKVKEKKNIYGKKDVTDRGLVHSFPGLTPEQFQEHSCGYGYISCWNRSIPFHPGPRLRVTIVPQPTTVIKNNFLVCRCDAAQQTLPPFWPFLSRNSSPIILAFRNPNGLLIIHSCCTPWWRVIAQLLLSNSTPFLLLFFFFFWQFILCFIFL